MAPPYVTGVSLRRRTYDEAMARPMTLEVAGRRVGITHPEKVVFPPVDGHPARTKLDLIRYYLAVADGALRGVADLKYASGTSAKEAVIHEPAGLAWAINLGCIDLNPHPVRADDLDHPD